MPPAALPPVTANSSEFRVDRARRARRLRGLQPIDDVEQAHALGLGQSISARGKVGDGLADDLALRLPKSGGCPLDRRDGGLVERERDANHNDEIIP